MFSENQAVNQEIDQVELQTNINVWNENYAYDTDIIVNFEGTQYISIRWNISEVPSSNESGPWTIYVEDTYVELEDEIPFYNGSAMEEDGFTLMQNHEAVVSVLDAFGFYKIKVFNTSKEKIVSRLLFPRTGDENTVLQWKSDTPFLISNQGEVNRPSNGKNMSVRLQLTVTKGSVSMEKEFELIVLAQDNKIVLNQPGSSGIATSEYSLTDLTSSYKSA